MLRRQTKYLHKRTYNSPLHEVKELLQLLQFPTYVFVRLQEGTLICDVKIKMHTSGEKNGFFFHYLHKYEMLGMIKMFQYKLRA